MYSRVMLHGINTALAFAEREPDFWHTAYRDHGPAVMGFLMRRVGRREEAEDLLQETFVRAMRFDSFQGGNLRGYLISTARNLLINRLRRPRLVVPAEPKQAGQQPFADVAAEEATPEEQAVWSSLQHKLDQAMTKLTEDHRRAFELAVLEQHTYVEITEITGWSLPRVRSNVHRARKKLIRQLGPHLAEDRGALS